MFALERVLGSQVESGTAPDELSGEHLAMADFGVEGWRSATL